MKNKFSPGEEVWIKARIEEVRITHGGIDYRVSVKDHGIPLYDTISEDAVQSSHLEFPLCNLSPYEFRQKVQTLRAKNEGITNTDIARMLGMTLQSFKQWLDVANSAPSYTTLKINYPDLKYEDLYKKMTLEEIREEGSSND